MKAQKIKSWRKLGLQKSLDLEVNHEDHNFLANGIVTQNSHSVAYSRLTALSVFCKFNHSSEFFLEAFKMAKNKQDISAEISELVQELPMFGIRLLPPSLTKSSQDFILEGRDIRYGMGSIKGISDKSIAHLQSFIDKEKTNLFQVFQAATQSKLNVSIVTSLVEVGCLEGTSPFDRQKTVLMLKIWKELTAREIAYCLEHGERYGFDLILMLKEYLTWTGMNGKVFGTEKRLETIRKKSGPFIQIYRENIKNPMVSQYLFEKKLLGYCPSTTLSELFRDYDDLSKINEVKTEKYEGELVRIMAEVVESKTGTAKKKNKQGEHNKYCKLTLSDETGNLNVLMTGHKWESYLAEFGEPEEGQIIYVRGQKGAGEDFVVFGDVMAPQYLKIYQRVSDLKKFGVDKEENGDKVTEIETEIV